MEGFFAPFGILRWKMESIPLRNTHTRSIICKKRKTVEKNRKDLGSSQHSCSLGSLILTYHKGDFTRVGDFGSGVTALLIALAFGRTMSLKAFWR